MYGKLKRKKPELNGHIIMANGIIQIDEYAEDILKPGARQREIRELILITNKTIYKKSSHNPYTQDYARFFV